MISFVMLVVHSLKHSCCLHCVFYLFPLCLLLSHTHSYTQNALIHSSFYITLSLSHTDTHTHTHYFSYFLSFYISPSLSQNSPQNHSQSFQSVSDKLSHKRMDFKRQVMIVWNPESFLGCYDLLVSWCVIPKRYKLEKK